MSNIADLVGSINEGVSSDEREEFHTHETHVARLPSL
jgi:hypothetical protein